MFVELSCLSSGAVLALQFRDDALGQHLAQLHAPLIERADVPDGALGEDIVLVERDQLAERFRREPLGEDGVGRAVALEDPVRHEPIRHALGLDLLRRHAERQRLALRKDVGQQHVVVAPQRRQRLAEGDEVARDEPRPLVNQLVERVLAVGARFAPIDGAGIVVHRRPLQRHVLAVALHRQLLQVGREPLQVLLVGQHRDGLRAEEVVVPDAPAGP